MSQNMLFFQGILKFFFSFQENIRWPPWVDFITILSHLALTVSCSMSFYIYYWKHGMPKQGMTSRMTQLKRWMNLSSDNNGDDRGELVLPDMEKMMEMEVMLETDSK